MTRTSSAFTPDPKKTKYKFISPDRSCLYLEGCTAIPLQIQVMLQTNRCIMYSCHYKIKIATLRSNVLITVSFTISSYPSHFIPSFLSIFLSYSFPPSQLRPLPAVVLCNTLTIVTHGKMRSLTNITQFHRRSQSWLKQYLSWRRLLSSRLPAMKLYCRHRNMQAHGICYACNHVTCLACQIAVS